MNSNRVTYEKLEIDLTYTKQSLGLVSNRGNCRFSRRISSHFRTPRWHKFFRAIFVTTHFFRTLLAEESRAKPLLTRTEVSAASQGGHAFPLGTHHSPIVTAFLIGQKTRSREILTCTKQITSHFLIGTEIAFFHSGRIYEWRPVAGVRPLARYRVVRRTNSRSLPGPPWRASDGRPRTYPIRCIGAGPG
jgi:hypothetical protein